MNCFLDTSALLKLYHLEDGSKALENYLSEIGDDLFILISTITTIEFRSALYRRVRKKELSSETINEILLHFQRDLQFIETVSMSDHLMQKATEILDQFADAISIKTLDALQLASAVVHHQVNPIDAFVAADNNLLRVASHYFSVFNPIES